MFLLQLGLETFFLAAVGLFSLFWVRVRLLLFRYGFISGFLLHGLQKAYAELLNGYYEELQSILLLTYCLSPVILDKVLMIDGRENED